MYTLNAPSDSNVSARATSRPAANQPVGCFSLGCGSFIVANSVEGSLRAIDSRRPAALRQHARGKPAWQPGNLWVRAGGVRSWTANRGVPRLRRWQPGLGALV